MATGGLSVPSTGSDGRGLDMLARLGHVVHPTYPALTPLLADRGPFAQFAGVSVAVEHLGGGRRSPRDRPAAVSSSPTAATAGPSVLDVSHVAVRSRQASGGPAAVRVRWGRLDAAGWEAALAPRGTRTVAGAVRSLLPERLADALIRRAGTGCRRGRSRSSGGRSGAGCWTTLTRDLLPWSGDEGYRKAEVTGGGVSLAEVHPADAGEPAASGAVPLWRAAGRVWADRGLQLSVGVGDGEAGWAREPLSQVLHLRSYAAAV